MDHFEDLSDYEGKQRKEINKQHDSICYLIIMYDLFNDV